MDLDEKTQEKITNLEAEIYADITTLDTIIKNFENGKIDKALFKRQYRFLMKNIYKTKAKLEKIGVNVSEFLEKENIIEEYRLAVKKLKLGPQDEQLLYDVMFESPAKIALLTMELTEAFDTISDLMELKTTATYGIVAEELQELKNAFIKYPGFNRNHKIILEIEELVKKLKREKQDGFLEENTIEKLKTKINDWREEFRVKLNELSA